MSSHQFISVIHYQPGHAGIKSMVEKTVNAYKKHDPKRKFFIYKPVDTKSGVAYCVVTDGKFGLLKKEMGEPNAKEVVKAAKAGVKSQKSFKSTTVRHGRGFKLGTPYLAVVKVTYNPADAAKIRQIAKKIESHAGTSKNYSVFTIKNIDNAFYIAFGVGDISILDKKGGLMAHVEDPAIQALFNEFKGVVSSMKLTKLRLLPQFSNIKG